MAANELILLVAGIIAIGVVSQVLASRYELPSIIFYLAAGILLGPEGAKLVTPELFGDALAAIVGLSVAIIVFEGAFHLKLSRLREAPRATLRLVTVGAAVALVGTAVAVRIFLGTTWSLAFLIGALLVATGPTVITPIMNVVAVRDRVATLLETEGIVNDVTAAILAVVFFQIVNPQTADTGLVADFTARLGTGILAGMVVAGVVYYLLQYVDLSPGNAPQNARLLVLAGALVAYAIANAQLQEAGVAAVATAGLLLGNADVPYEKEITDFKGDITLLVLSFVFIALAALLRVDVLLELIVPKLLVVAAVALLIRPLIVFLSTIGNSFTFRERIFVSAVGPRGIIPASVATLFAVELRAQAVELESQAAAATGAEATQLLQEANLLAQQADLLVGTVFLVILVTVVFEGGLARHLGEYLDIVPMRVIIVGGGSVGRALATRLEDRGEDVVLIEEDNAVVERARNQGFTVEMGDGTDIDVLRSAGAENAKTIVAATRDDDVNLLVAQLVNATFETEDVIVRANDPEKLDAYEELGVQAIDAPMATAWALDNEIERPAISHWMTDIGEYGDVQEVEVTCDPIANQTLAELSDEFPDDCLVALVSRDGETWVPDAETVIQMGDKLTVIGEHDAVRDAMAVCQPSR